LSPIRKRSAAMDGSETSETQSNLRRK